MAVISELIRNEADGTISFGDYSLASKSKVEDFKHGDDSYKVKTYAEITKLERNGVFVYESVPGTSVEHFSADENSIAFSVEGNEDAQITLELEPETAYSVEVAKAEAKDMVTNLGGKLNLSVELDAGVSVEVVIKKK